MMRRIMSVIMACHQCITVLMLLVARSLAFRCREHLWRSELASAFALLDVDNSGELDEIEFRYS